MITLKEYADAKQELSVLEKQGDMMIKNHQEESSKIQSRFWKLEEELEKKKRKAEGATRRKHTSEIDVIKKQKQPYLSILDKYKRILDLMEVQQTAIELSREITKFEIYKYDYPRDEKGEVIRVMEGNCLCYPEKIQTQHLPVHTIKNDEYAMIQVFIVEDKNKPVNKYALIIAGKSIFNKSLIELPYGYGCPCHNYSTNIILLVRNKPTKEELQSYYLKNKDKILKEFLAEHKKLEQEYEDTIKVTDTNEWRIAFWENKKEYYEKYYRHGTETDEYKAVLKKLKDLKAGD